MIPIALQFPQARHVEPACALALWPTLAFPGQGQGVSPTRGNVLLACLLVNASAWCWHVFHLSVTMATLSQTARLARGHRANMPHLMLRGPNRHSHKQQ